MSYADHLRALLRPLGVYQLSAESLSGGELEALGEAFDDLYLRMEEDLREALPVTAEGYGLSTYESLLGYPCLPESVETRRAAILGLLQMHARGSGQASLEAAAAFTGTTVTVEPDEQPDRLSVTLGYTQIPDHWQAIRRYLGDIMPCHLETHYYMTEE